MKKNILAVSTLTLLAATLLAPMAQAAEEDMSKGDPSRWYQADDSPEARYGNLQKEANAAYGEAVLACKGLRAKALRACRSDAQAARKDDMARAKRIREDYKTSSAKQ